MLRKILSSGFAGKAVRPSALSLRSASRLFSTAYFPDIDSSKLSITRTTQPKAKAPKETLKFGQLMTDHMLEVDWSADKGWTAPRIVPYQPLQLDPAASVLHYGIESFEGMKAYIDADGHIRMFRPDMNMKRLNKSNHRLLMPTFNNEELIRCIGELLKVEKDWIPKGHGYSLYIRPTCIGTHAALGVAPSSSCKLYVICSPVGPYYPSGWNPIKLLADPSYVRAWPGGTGNAKVGGNYALGIRPAMEAAKKGYSQMLWLYGPDHQVTEVGTMNIFFFMYKKDGKTRELITAPLDDGTILPGVTRDSILQLTRQWGEFEVSERRYTIHEIIDALNEGRMIECFGSGTAAVVCPVKAFAFQDKEYDVPLDKENPESKIGKLTAKIAHDLLAIQYGQVPHPWSVRVD